MKGIIYKWTCSKSGKSYIGQTINEKKRENEFFNKNEYYTGKNSKIDKARNKYGLSNDIWSKEVLKKLWCKEGKEKELLERLNYWEKYYIEKYDTFNNGYNSTNGGDKPIISEEIKKILSNKSYEQHSKNKNHVTKETSIKISNKIKEYHINKKNKLNCIAKKIRKLPVYKIDKNTNEILNKYESIEKAGKENNISSTSIRIVCRNGIRKTAGGFKWKFCNDANEIKQIKGYDWIEKIKRWRSRVKYNRKSYVLGMFIKENTAKTIYLKAKEKIKNGEFTGWYENIINERYDIMKECEEI